MKLKAKITNVETLACDAGWRNYHFVKLTTDEGAIGWSEFDEVFLVASVGFSGNSFGSVGWKPKVGKISGNR